MESNLASGDLISDRYALALYELSIEDNLADVILDDLRESGIDCPCSLLGSSGFGLAQIRTSVPFTASRPLLWISCDIISVLSLHSLTQLVTSIMSPYEDGARNSE